jgi:hypothetical protein
VGKAWDWATIRVRLGETRRADPAGNSYLDLNAYFGYVVVGYSNV